MVPSCCSTMASMVAMVHGGGMMMHTSGSIVHPMVHVFSSGAHHVVVVLKNKRDIYGSFRTNCYMDVKMLMLLSHKAQGCKDF